MSFEKKFVFFKQDDLMIVYKSIYIILINIMQDLAAVLSKILFSLNSFLNISELIR